MELYVIWLGLVIIIYLDVRKKSLLDVIIALV